MQDITDGALRMVLDTLEVRVAYLDADLRFQYANAAFAASVGRTAEELTGSKYVELFPEGEARALLERVCATQETALLRAVAQYAPSCPGAETTYWDWKMTPLKREDTFGGVLISITDVTEREETQRKHTTFLEDMATIREIGRQLLSERTVEGLLQRTVDAARHLTRGQLAVVGRISCCGIVYETVRSRDATAPDWPVPEALLIERMLDPALLADRPSIHLAGDELAQIPAWQFQADKNPNADRNPNADKSPKADGRLREPGVPGNDEHALPEGLLVAQIAVPGDRSRGLIAVLRMGIRRMGIRRTGTREKVEGDFRRDDETLLAELASIASLRLQQLEAQADAERRADQLDAVIEAMIDPVLVYNADGEPIRANAAAMATAGGVDPVGADRAQLLHTFTVTHPDGRPVAIPDLPSNCALRGETVKNERLVLHREGEDPHPIVATASPIYYYGVQDGAVLVWRDLTQLQLAQETRDRLADILERTPDLISTATPDGRLLYANRAARETIGVPETEVLGQPVVRAHPDWAAKVVLEEAVPTAMREGMWRGQTAIVSHDGHEIPVSQVILAHRGPNGEVAYLSTILRDISVEQRLLEENRRQRWFLERLQAALPVGVAVVSGPEHRYEYANHYYQVAIHHQEESLVGRALGDVLPAYAAERATAMLEEVHRTRIACSAHNLDLRATPEDESRYWDIDHVPLFSEDDAIEAVLILAYEVTDAVQTQKALDDERTRLQAIIDSVPDGIVVADKQARLALINQAGARIYGHPLRLGERYDRQPEIPLYTPDGVRYDPRNLHIVRSALDGEVCHDEEVIVVDANGQQRHLLVDSSPVRDSAGAPDGAVVAYRDITARVELQRAVEQHAKELDQQVAERTEALRASQERLRAIFEAAAVGVGVSDAEGRMVECNPALAAITGYSAEELLTMRFADFTHPDDVDADMVLLRELVAGKRDAYQLEKRYVRKDGETVWVNLTCSLLRDGPDQPPLAIGIVEDISARKEAQEALIQAEKLSAAGRLAASLAHEINNPLQSVIGCLGLAERKLARGEEVAQYIQVARQELRRAARVVAQMRDLHRRSRVGTRERTEVSALLEQVLLVTAKQCENQGVGVTLRKPEMAPAAMAVPDQLRQVFLNLVLNAIDAMPDGGLLDVAVTTTTDPLGVSIQFRDSGTGIAPEVLPRLFEPFYSTRAGGLGLGLFISRNIVEDHAGHIEVRSTVDEGSTFTVWLPEAERTGQESKGGADLELTQE
jgi:two-component system NtrC family sensor kinase